MIYRITMKDPDHTARTIQGDDVQTSELAGKAEKLFRKFFEYSEYVEIELDTDKGTATVVPVSGL